MVLLLMRAWLTCADESSAPSEIVNGLAAIGPFWIKLPSMVTSPKSQMSIGHAAAVLAVSRKRELRIMVLRDRHLNRCPHNASPKKLSSTRTWSELPQ